MKIDFDCNDGDCVYGLQVINERTKEIIDRNLKKEVIFGSCVFGENTNSVENCVDITEITDTQYLVLKELNLLEFGEGGMSWINDLDDAEEWEDPDSDDDEEIW
jgi:hypothetical protein